jgi:hypothetical protein
MGKIYGERYHKQQQLAPSNVASEPVVPDPVKALDTHGNAALQGADQQQRANGSNEKVASAHEDAAMPKPQTYNGDIARLPPALEHLRDQKVWVNWCWFWNGKKWTKPPRRVDDPSRNASTSDPTTWGTYEQAVEQVRDGGADGIGLALKGRDIGANDLDHCRDPVTGRIEAWADNYLRRFPGAYVEITVSGKGLRILGTSALESFAPKFKLNTGNGAAIELFSNSHHYITLSCNEVGSCAELPRIGDTMEAIAAELRAPQPKQDALDFDAAARVDDAPPIAPADDVAAQEQPDPAATGSAWSFDEETRLRSALGAIPTDEAVLAEKFGHAHDIWVKIGRAIERLDWGERGYAIWRDWSAQNAAEFNEKGLRTQWASFNHNRNGRERPITIATVYHYAIACGWRFRLDSAGADYAPGTNGNAGQQRTNGDGHRGYSERAKSSHAPNNGRDRDHAPEAPRPLMRELPPAGPFPTDALGELLAKAAFGIQDRTRAPIAMCAQSVLAAAALATQGHANVRLPTGQVRPLSSYFVTVGVSGERKSAVDAEATWPMAKYEATLRDQYGPQRLDYENGKDAWDKARDHAKNTGKGDKAAIKFALDRLGAPPSEPPLPRLTCSEPTIEGLVKLFAAGRPSLGLFADEGGMFIGGHAMTEEAKLRTASTLSKLWDGAVIDRVRGGEGVISLPGRRLAAHLMMQPAVAAMLLSDALLADQGLLSRVLVTYPASTIGERTWLEASAAADKAVRGYGARLLDILERPLPVDEKGKGLKPRDLELSPDARRLWIAFHDHVEVNLKEEVGAFWPIRGFANKMPEHAARLAGVLTLVEDFGAPAIDPANMQRGIELVEHHACEALRLFEASQISADLALAQRLLDWVHRQWPEEAISLPDIYQRSLNAIGDQAAARKVVNILVGHGWLELIPGGAIIAGRRRREAWRIVRGA